MKMAFFGPVNVLFQLPGQRLPRHCDRALLLRKNSAQQLTLVLLSLLLIGFPVKDTQAQTISERAYAEALGRQFAEAINLSSDSSRLQAVKEIFSSEALRTVSLDKYAKLMNNLNDRLNPFQYHHSELITTTMAGGETRAVLHVYGRKEDAPMWSDIQVRLDPEPPHKFLSIAFLAEVSEPIYLPNGTIDQKETLQWLEEYVDKLVRENDLSGSILIVRDTTILFERYFGFADAGRKRTIDRNTLFNLGSGNKMFTALGIMKLVEQGDLHLTDSLLKFFPDFPDRARAGRVTIHHLLSHTSGIAEYWTESTRQRLAQCRTLDDHKPIVYSAGFEEDPGTSYHYSNSNFILLGLILEKVTGSDYFSYIKHSVFRKAGMQKTDSYFSNETQEKLAIPLARGNSGWIPAARGQRGSSAGGGYSNGREMLKFLTALKNDQIVSASTLKSMTTSKTTGLREADHYGYGFMIEQHGGENTIGHGGIAKGVNFSLHYFPQSGYVVLVFSNQDNGAFDDLKKNALKLVSGAR